MNATKWMLLAAMLLPSLAVATDKPKEITTPPIKVQVQVDATGHLADITPKAKMAEPFVAVIRRTVSGWRFHPARVNGKPVVTTTWLTLGLKVQPQDNGNAAVQVLYYGNGPDVAFGNPAYPRDMLRAQREARIVFEATVGVDGHLSEPKIVEALTSDGGPAVEFVNNVLDAARKATAQPIIVDGQPVVSHIRLPVSFGFSQHDSGPGPSSASDWARQFERASDSSKYVVHSPTLLPSSRLAPIGDVMVVLDSPVGPVNSSGS